MTNSIEPEPLAALQTQTVDKLKTVRENLDSATRDRLTHIRVARSQKLTHSAIGDALGITEGAVRGLLARNNERA